MEIFRKTLFGDGSSEEPDDNEDEEEAMPKHSGMHISRQCHNSDKKGKDRTLRLLHSVSIRSDSTLQTSKKPSQQSFSYHALSTAPTACTGCGECEDDNVCGAGGGTTASMSEGLSSCFLLFLCLRSLYKRLFSAVDNEEDVDDDDGLDCAAAVLLLWKDAARASKQHTAILLSISNSTVTVAMKEEGGEGGGWRGLSCASSSTLKGGANVLSVDRGIFRRRNEAMR